MSNYLYEKRIEELLQDKQHNMQQESLLAGLSRDRRSTRGRHIISTLGTHLVTLGKWLEQAEPHKVSATSR